MDWRAAIVLGMLLAAGLLMGWLIIHVLRVWEAWHRLTLQQERENEERIRWWKDQQAQEKQQADKLKRRGKR